jgi:thermostable 8-oxoguanine DNA glycosylase
MKASVLEYRLLYSMVVAGKSATFAENALGRFFEGVTVSPFAHIRHLVKVGQLENRLRQARTGNYGKLAIGFSDVAHLSPNLATVSAEALEMIHGIGPKTSRFFIIWTRPDAAHAALDTHVLKWLRFIGHEAPLSTPSGRKYALLEVIMLEEAKKRGMTARQLDSAIWDWCASGQHIDGTWPANLQPVAK